MWIITSRQAKIYIATEAVYGVAMGMYGFILNLFLESIGLNLQSIGSLTSLGIMVTGLCALPLGFCARHTGRKNMYAGGVLLIGLNIILYVFCPTRLILLPAVFLAIGMTMVEVSEVQVMYHCCENDAERITVYSAAFAFFILGSAVGTFLAGHLPAWLGSYRSAMLLSGIITLTVGSFRWFLLTPDHANPSAKGFGKITPAFLKKVVDRRFTGFMIVVTMHGALASTIGPYSTLILKYQSGWQDGAIASVLTLAPVFQFIMAIFTPVIQHRKYSVGTYLIIYFLLIINYLALALCGNITVFMVLFIVRCGLEVVIKNMIDSVAYLILDDRQQDIYSGIRSLAKGIAGAGMAFLVGIFLDRVKINYIFYATAGLMTCAAGLFLIFITPILKIKKHEEAHL